MNRRITTTLWLLLLGTLSYLANCADPLEPTGPSQDPEPIYVVDTISDIDTIIQIDTVPDIDTLPDVDTIIRIDTVIVTDTVGTTDTLTIIDSAIVVDTVVEIDTVLDIDTVFDVDTVNVIDTIIWTDTVEVIDTVIETDTVVIVVPDTGSFRPFCGTLASNQQEIVWMFRNPAGQYRLEFTATMVRAQPNQSLTVQIDDQTYLWDPNDLPEYDLETGLNQHATIRIIANKPPARGHSIYVCLQVTQLW